jgi:Mitosis protein DIM1
VIASLQTARVQHDVRALQPVHQHVLLPQLAHPQISVATGAECLQVPAFNAMYELYDPCTIMFFFRNKHIQIDLGTGNNNKINWALTDKQEFIDIVETVYKGARKGRGLVVSPKGAPCCPYAGFYGLQAHAGRPGAHGQPERYKCWWLLRTCACMLVIYTGARARSSAGSCGEPPASVRSLSTAAEVTGPAATM